MSILHAYIHVPIQKDSTTLLCVLVLLWSITHTHTHTHTYTLVSLSNTDIEVNLCILKPTADNRYNRLFFLPFSCDETEKNCPRSKKGAPQFH